MRALLEAKKQVLASVSVPGVYPDLSDLCVCAILAVRRINNLWSFNVGFSSIPTATTIHLPDGSTLNKNARGKKGQIRSEIGNSKMRT
jgi:hypothetical protein